MKYIAKSKEERAFIRRPRNLLAEYSIYLATPRSPRATTPGPTPGPGPPARPGDGPAAGKGRTMLDLAIDIRYPPSRYLAWAVDFELKLTFA